MNLSPFWLGVLRGIGYPAVTLVLAYFSDVNHIMSAGVSLTTATLLAALIAGIEHAVEGQTGNALFGAVRTN